MRTAFTPSSPTYIGTRTASGPPARSDASAARYARDRPERTLLYEIVQARYPVFLAALASRYRRLPDYVQREFEDFLACDR